MYYDGIIEFTRRHVDKRTNGGNDFRADWYCPKCGDHRINAWSGSEDHEPVGNALAIGCPCGLMVESGSFIKVDQISVAAMQPLAVVPLRGPTPPKKVVNDGLESYVCGCCGLAGDSLSAGNRVEVNLVGGGYVGRGEALSFMTSSTGHQIWKVKFDDGHTHNFGRGCLRQLP